ncbi:unnamed protein product [Cladocopium goreaui]|uniref:Retrovirus-related Pol polyprotein from transposon RE1 (Retro element 1) (AtRE1) n=1 Tax=Cladocopium goreaui TaxID=2562237 RepID=A0A9P1FWZ1_9DINO|nr:unnamed protein product [Cladocopium goreaui]
MPKNVWFSPTCGPWSSWNNLNAARSVEAFDQIHQQRVQHLYQLALGIVLCRVQTSRGQHFHWEQPRRSLMFRTPLLRELYDQTMSATFDMCRVGQLRDPENQLLMQKGLEVRTTCHELYTQLHGRYCRHDHQHQVLEGTTIHQGERKNRTEFSELYPRKFARYVSKILCKVKTVPCQSSLTAEPSNTFAASTKRQQSNSGSARAGDSKRIKNHHAKLIEPSQMPRKRRRTCKSTPDDQGNSELSKDIVESIKPILPRVGKTEIRDPEIIRKLQKLFDDKRLVRVIACKGTERTIPPPQGLLAEEAPFRRAMVVQRGDYQIKVEDQWEESEQFEPSESPQSSVLERPMQDLGTSADSRPSASDTGSDDKPLGPLPETGTTIELDIQDKYQGPRPPNEFIADSATEFNNEAFGKFLQQFNTKGIIIPPEAHWQLSKSERHGDILQHMLSKFEEDFPIESYADLQVFNSEPNWQCVKVLAVRSTQLTTMLPSEEQHCAETDPTGEAINQEPDMENPAEENVHQALRTALETPVPETDDELLCDMLTCTDAEVFLTSEPHENLAWRFELDMPQNIPEENTIPIDDLILLATNQKKQRTEVKLSHLTMQEQEEFEKAKASEVNNWLQTGTVSKALRSSLSPEQILKCRWIHVWKPIEDKAEQERQNKTRKAKSRLVVLGYMDPELETIPRDSPTLGRQSRMLILQLIASMMWTLTSFDIKAAFLQGKTQEGRKIGLEPVPELARAMRLKENEICRLEKSAYGLIDAPFLWFKELDRILRQLSFVPSPFDPCVYLLYKENTRTPSGVIGMHVDDGLCGGDEYFEEQLAKLEAVFPFGSKKSQNFVFTGIEMTQQHDRSIILSQEKYVTKIEPIHINNERKQQPDLPISAEEKLELRGIIGSLQYAAVNTRPDLSSRLSHLQSAINTATISTLTEANKTLHEAKRHKDTKIKIQPIDIKQLRFLAFSDASFSSPKQPDSHSGSIIMATHSNITQNYTCPVNAISWGCKKIQKVVVSTLSAETMSLNSTLDQLSWIRLFWGWLLNPTLNWKQPKETLNNLPTTIAAPTLKPIEPSIAVTDCKSLYDLVTRTAPPSCQEYRTQLLARSIKDLLSEGITLRWVHSGAQLADALTKVMQATFLRQTLELGTYKLHDENAILKDRASARSRMQWLHENANEAEKRKL